MLNLHITNLKEKYQTKHGDYDHASKKIGEMIEDRINLVNER
jgi:hypothetical protein